MVYRRRSMRKSIEKSSRTDLRRGSGNYESIWKSPSAKRRKLVVFWTRSVRVIACRGADWATGSTVVSGCPTPRFPQHHPLLGSSPSCFHPRHEALKLPDPTPPTHFQYRPSSAPTPLRTRDVCEAWHLRSVLWHSTPRIVFSLLAFILEFTPRFHLPCLLSPTPVPFFQI